MITAGAGQLFFLAAAENAELSLHAWETLRVIYRGARESAGRGVVDYEVEAGP